MKHQTVDRMEKEEIFPCLVFEYSASFPNFLEIKGFTQSFICRWLEWGRELPIPNLPVCCFDLSVNEHHHVADIGTLNYISIFG